MARRKGIPSRHLSAPLESSLCTNVASMLCAALKRKAEAVIPHGTSCSHGRALRSCGECSGRTFICLHGRIRFECPPCVANGGKDAPRLPTPDVRGRDAEGAGGAGEAGGQKRRRRKKKKKRKKKRKVKVATGPLMTPLGVVVGTRVKALWTRGSDVNFADHYAATLKGFTLFDGDGEPIPPVVEYEDDSGDGSSSENSENEEGGGEGGGSGGSGGSSSAASGGSSSAASSAASSSGASGKSGVVGRAMGTVSTVEKGGGTVKYWLFYRDGAHDKDVPGEDIQIVAWGEGYDDDGNPLGGNDRNGANGKSVPLENVKGGKQRVGKKGVQEAGQEARKVEKVGTVGTVGKVGTVRGAKGAARRGGVGRPVKKAAMRKGGGSGGSGGRGGSGGNGGGRGKRANVTDVGGVAKKRGRGRLAGSGSLQKAETVRKKSRTVGGH